MKALANHLEQFTSAPFLFVGSGLSRRYLALPTWEGLLRHFAEPLPKAFEYYSSKQNSVLPAVAELMAEDFHEIWWSDEKYAASRSAHHHELRTISSALKIEICNFLHSHRIPRLSATLRRETELLRNVVIDGVITTNWDDMLEVLFPDYRVFVGQDELLFSSTQGIGEIYKIHGSVTKPNSLVLTTEDYENYNRRNSYLAAKLLAVFVEHPTIFLGYSLNDPNIHEILGQVALSLTHENLGLLQDRLIIVTFDPSVTTPSFVKTSLIVGDYSIPVIVCKAKSFSPIYSVLTEFKRKFSARVLRQLKEHVYSLVLHNDPQGQLFVQDIENTSSIPQADVVLGVGARQLLPNAFSLTSDPTAPLIAVKEQDLFSLYPMDYSQLNKAMREKYSNFVENNDWHRLRRGLEGRAELCLTRYLDPSNTSGSLKRFYSRLIFEETDKVYSRVISSEAPGVPQS